MSLTERSCIAMKFKMSRRRGSATALKASEVVEARAMGLIYSHIGICQAFFLMPNFVCSIRMVFHPSRQTRLYCREIHDFPIPGAIPGSSAALSGTCCFFFRREFLGWYAD